MKYNKRKFKSFFILFFIKKLAEIEFSVFSSLRKLCVFASLREISCQKTTEFDFLGNDDVTEKVDS